MELLVENAGRSTFLVYKMQENDELDSIGLGMIENNSISGVLPIALNHFDDEMRLTFNITSQISLEKLLMGKISRKKILTVFMSICDAFLESEEYLLEDNFFLLDNKYIYTNASNGKASLIYFPIIREADPVNLPAYFKELIFSIQSDPDENCDYVAKIISFLNSRDGFDLLKFRELLYFLRQTDESQKKTARVQDMWIVNNNDFFHVPEKEVKEQILNDNSQTAPSVPASKSKDDHNFDFVYPDTDIGNSPADNVDSPEHANKKKSLFGGLFKKKNTKTEKKSLFGKKKEIKEEVLPAFDFAIPDQDINSGAKYKKDDSIIWELPDPQNNIGVSGNNQKTQKAVNQAVSGIAINKKQKEYDEDAGYTIMGSYDDPDEEDLTQLDMTSPDESEKQRNRSASLTRISNGERMEISGDMIRIGRQRDAVDFMVTGNKSVSHTHADIIRRYDNYYICDLNSKNHTYLNGDELVSGREYLLHTGDEIRLSNEEFVFSE